MPTRIEALWTAKDVAIYLQVSLSWVRHASRPGREHSRSAASAERKAGVTPVWGADASLSERAASPCRNAVPFIGGSRHG